MKKYVLFLVLFLISGIASLFAGSMTQITLGEEDESVLFFNDSEMYFMLPYEKKMMKMDRKLLAYDNDGFLKLTFKGRQALIIDGQGMKQLFRNFRTDGKNNYDRYANSEESTGGYSPFYSYNVKSISASSYLKEKQYGQDIAYAPMNLFRAFEVGCKCHPYWWNYSHIPWVEGVKGYGINETISIEFKDPVYGFSILNGYADVQNMKLFKENSRVKKLKVEDLTNKLEYVMDFEDKVYFNYMELKKPSKSIKLTILDVYKGTKYQDTCISAMIDNISESSDRDWEMENFNYYKNLCSYSNDTSLFEKYFEYISQPIGSSSIYEKTETVNKASNLFNQDFYWIDDYNTMEVSEDTDSRYTTLTFKLGSNKYDSQNAEMYIDKYGYKHLKLFDKNMKLEHHFTIIDTYTVKVNEDDKWGWLSEPNVLCYSFLEHTSEFLKDDKKAVEKYFSSPSFRQNNGGSIKAYKVSSYLKESKTSYAPENTGKVYTIPVKHHQVNSWSNQIKPWVEGKKDDGIGETFEFDMMYSSKLPWDIRILNGYVDPLKPHLFKENNRIKKARLETDTGIKKEINFRDEVEFTQIILPEEVKHVKLTILEVYKGTKYQDTCITSVEVNNKESER
ncbi:MAG: hypothetical protein J5857_02515 [Treponema sp.]|nr:hypothetical protein [Treponema sp.]